MKYLFVTGGTISGLGKGTAISSLGVVLKSHGLKVTAIKIDPYLNVDAGTMSPFEHGEVYVLEDGGEADLDLGNYERFLDILLTADHSVTSGKIYDQVIKRERTGHYLGKTVQMVPHVTDAIQEWIMGTAQKPVDKTGGCPEICLVELGGTVGDIESAVYLEALQQFQFKVGPENFLMVHVGMVPVVGATGEQKTKPCQHSVKLLRQAGVKPDLILTRCEQPLLDSTREKLSLFCQVPKQNIISLHDISNLYSVPVLLAEQDAGKLVCNHFRLCDNVAAIGPTLSLGDFSMERSTMAGVRLGDWQIMADRVDACGMEVIIALVGKYAGNHDAYVSVIKGLKHASIEAGLHLVIEWVDSQELEPNMLQIDSKRYDSAWRRLKAAHGVLVPGGFGDRGTEGKIMAANYCRTSDTPYFGICLGFQVAVIDFARSVVGWESANSAEFDESTPHPVVVFMPEASRTQMGGTMRLGSRVTILRNDKAISTKLYGGNAVVYERHRHRYEVNPSCVKALEAKGLCFVGQDERGLRMELAEIPDHRFFVGCQFHPEFKSRPSRPSPLFCGLVLASAGLLEKRLEEDGGVLRPGAGFSRKTC
jgi:CTP synthase